MKRAAAGFAWALALALALGGCATSPAPSSPGPAAASPLAPAQAPAQAPAPGWTKALDGRHATAWTHEGVAIPATVLANLRSTAPHQLTVLMRSCSAEGVPQLKVEHLQGRVGQTRESLVSATRDLAQQEDSAAAANVLEYAFVLGHAGLTPQLISTLRVFRRSGEDAAPEVAGTAALAQTVDAEQLFLAFPALALPCPPYEAATVTQSLSLQDIVAFRLRPTDAGQAERSFGRNAAEAVKLFNDLHDVMSAVRHPSHIAGFRFYEDGKARAAQASKWLLQGGTPLTLVLESQGGEWTLRARGLRQQ